MTDGTISQLITALPAEKRALLAKLLALGPEPVAVIGMGCRFPGGAHDPEGFWQLLRDEVDAITEVPPDRWDVNALYDPDPDAPGKMTTRWGGFVNDVDRFDPAFFGIAPREAAAMDPQQRLLLEVAWEALDDAGQTADAVQGSRTGVFIGICNNDYLRLNPLDPCRIDAYTGTGNQFSVAAGRLSYLLDLRGPSLAVDTACSSSLVAVHLAFQSLRKRDCDLALVGGVNLMLSPLVTIYASRSRMMAADGRCKTFDARADGFVRGEGCGVVVLKRLSDAQRDGDRIWAVLRGTACNQDGRTHGLTAPNVLAQQALIRQALDDAGVAPSAVSYVEAHGTGTALGDPIEVEALSEVLGARTPAAPPCALGSVKTNIGHLEAAAGMAGLIKVVLALTHEVIPAHLHFRQLNPHITLDHTRFVIPTSAQPWPRGPQPRLAGVSSFGFSGTNAHVVLEEAPALNAPPRAAGAVEPAALLPLSARSAAGLRAVAGRYAAWLPTATTAALADLTYSASVRRTHHEHRLAVVGSTRAALAAALAAVAQGEERPECTHGSVYAGPRPKLVFVFPGQGAQWLGMGRELLASEPVFRATLEQCEAAIARHAGWSLLAELAADPAHSRLAEVDVVQPCLFALQVALAALWQAWGLSPDAVIGHSLGEVAAAQVAGLLSLEDAAQVICARSRLVKRTSGQGAMAMVELAWAEAEREVAAVGDGSVALAASNGPRTTLLSGAPGALKALVHTLEQRAIFCRWINVDYASHSAQMDALGPELEAALADIRPQAGTIPMLSTVSAEYLRGAPCTPRYWRRNLREPVRFWPAVEALVDSGHECFLEVSAHPVLGPALRDGMAQGGRRALVVGSLRRQSAERAALLESVGALYTHGYPLDWRRLYPAGGGRAVALPGYAWQRERFWLAAPEATELAAPAVARRAAGGEHPLLGPRWQSALQADTHYWEVELSVKAFPYLADHRVGAAAVFPAAAYLETALAAATTLWGLGSHTAEQLNFEKALVLPEDGVCSLQVVVTEIGAGRASIQFFSRPNAAPETPWILHATGMLVTAARPDDAVAAEDLNGGHPAPNAPAEIRQRCHHELTGAEHYEALRARTLDFGPSFQTIEHLWCGSGEALGRLRSAAIRAADGAGYHVHPTLLDAAFQVVAAAVKDVESAVTEGDPYLPIAVEHLEIGDRLDEDLWAHAVVRSRSDATVVADVSLMRADGTVVLAAHGLRAQRLSGRAAPSACEYALAWQPQARPEPSTGTDQRPGTWLLLSERAGCGAALAAALRARGEHPVLVYPGPHYAELAAAERYELDPNAPEDFARLLSAVFHNGQPACRAVVHLWGLEEGAAEDPAAAEARAAERLAGVAARCSGVLHLVQALARAGWRDAPRLWVVTAGAQAVANESPTALAQAPLWGLGKVIALEHPEWRCTLLDVAPASDPTGTAATLLAELCTDSTESAIALRPAGRFVPRLVHAPALPATAVHRVAAHGQPYRVEIAAPGILDQLELRACARRPPGPGEVEIQVEAAALNFKDVLLAMGVVPAPGPVALGGECAGTVTAVGAGVNTVALGAAVVAIAPWSFARFVTTPATLVLAKPAGLSFAQAAALPLVSMTAHYALCQVGRLQAGERVLIHAAAGGVGLAAVHLAQQLGAEIFATAGSAEKRAYLESLGVAHVLDSRSLEFAAEVLRRTAGHGVDVVVNSLAGAAALSKNLEALGPYGRFVEIGVRDLYANTPLGLAPFQKGLSYTAIDLGRLARERPAQFAALFHTVMAQVADGQWPPLPLTVFPISQVAAACRHMAQAKHIGKVVLTLDDPEVRLAPASTPHFRADATYLITGGLGGLGLTVAQWLVTHGARHLLLVGRRGAPPAAAPALAALRAAGAVVEVAAVDVADRAQLHALLTADAASRPPVAGVIHAAAVLDDGVLLRLDRTRFASVLAPKLAGAWNLHQLTRELPLDFFVLFSSAAALLGSPGQANYSAANAFLDALAHYRRAHGLPALSINWGPWAEVGLAAAAATRGERLAFRGLRSLSPAVATAALGRLLSAPVAQMGVLDFDLRQWCQYFPAAAELPVLAELAQEIARPAARAPSPLRAELAAAEPARRRELLDAHLRQQIGRVLRLDSSQIDPQQPLSDLGFDSLMAIEFRNCLEMSLGVTLSATILWNYRTLATLTAHLASKMQLPLEKTAAEQSEAHETRDEMQELSAHVEQLSVDQTAALLAQELSAIQQSESV